jgi:hypothetical protein
LALLSEPRGLAGGAPQREEQFARWWMRARKSVAKVRRKAFDSFVILIAWLLWLQRNDRVLNRVSTLEVGLVDSIWMSLEQWVHVKLFDRSLVLGE